MDKTMSMQDFIKDYMNIISSIRIKPKEIKSGEEMVMLSAQEYEEMKQQLIVQERDEEVKNTMKEGKTYANMHEFISDFSK